MRQPRVPGRLNAVHHPPGGGIFTRQHAAAIAIGQQGQQAVGFGAKQLKFHHIGNQPAGS
jgi:hypothetical protein